MANGWRVFGQLSDEGGEKQKFRVLQEKRETKLNRKSEDTHLFPQLNKLKSTKVSGLWYIDMRVFDRARSLVNTPIAQKNEQGKG